MFNDCSCLPFCQAGKCCPAAPGVLYLLLVFGQFILQSLFDPFTGLPGKMGPGMRVTGGKLFATQGTMHHHQLVFKAPAVFAHHQMQIHQQPLMPRQFPVHGFGHFSGYFFAAEHPV
jgi:hypothetical protein